MKKKKEWKRETERDSKSNCYYPGCSNKSTYTFKIASDKDNSTSIELPFCKYHWFIVAGNHFKCHVTKEHHSKNFRYDLVGPTETITIVEQVMGAIQYVEKKDKKK